MLFMLFIYMYIYMYQVGLPALNTEWQVNLINQHCSNRNDLFSVHHPEQGQIELVTGAFSALTVSNALHHSEHVCNTFTCHQCILCLY